MKRKQVNIGQIWNKIGVRRQYKDRLFQRVFQEKKYLLELYNALNHSSYDNPDDLQITTLEDVIYMSMKNDLAFIIGSRLNLYEHQSTFNPNMPMRGLFYFARMYEAYVKRSHEDIYGRKLIKVPAPQYVIFYNGQEYKDDEVILKLSDAFEEKKTGEAYALECTAKMVNINYGHNEELMKACTRLRDYSIFIDQINERLQRGKTLRKAIKEAMDYCIENNVLVDVLEKQQSEVFNMILTEFNERKYKKFLKKQGLEEGREIGREEAIEKIVKRLQKFGISQPEVIAAIEEDYHLSKNEAEEKVKLYWE